MGYPFVLPDMVGGNAYSEAMVDSAALGQLLAERGRTALLAALKERGVHLAHDRSAIADALAAALDDGRIPRRTEPTAYSCCSSEFM